MLRATPKPPRPMVLSCDIGSQNSAWCLYGDDRRIWYWKTHKLLEVHEPRVSSTAEALGRLDAITRTIENMLQGRDYFVLIEDQPMAQTDMQKGLLFNRELQHIVHAYFHAKGRQVRLIDALERYRLLGITEPTKLSRSLRKAKVVAKVHELLAGPFGKEPMHDLLEWQSGTKKKDDLADALAQALAYMHRNLAGVTTTSETTASSTHTPVNSATLRGPPPVRKKPRVPVTKEEVQGRLEALMGHLQIQHYELIKAHKDYAKKIYHVYSSLKDNSQTDPQMEDFLQLLHQYNHQGTTVTDATSLAARLAGIGASQ